MLFFAPVEYQDNHYHAWLRELLEVFDLALMYIDRFSKIMGGAQF
jgi:hypothetical protein